jgi:hypothetical protein
MAMKQADAVLQEVWRIKDAALKQAGGDGHQLVQQLREQSAALRAELQSGVGLGAVKPQLSPHRVTSAK